MLHIILCNNLFTKPNIGPQINASTVGKALVVDICWSTPWVFDYLQHILYRSTNFPESYPRCDAKPVIREENDIKNSKNNSLHFGGLPVKTETAEEADELMRVDEKASEIYEDFTRSMKILCNNLFTKPNIGPQINASTVGKALVVDICWSTPWVFDYLQHILYRSTNFPESPGVMLNL
uniref:Uncharacterized protein n=1 Tax=Helianthus annuus TaxID=4232 RepID=A0A251RYX3_HELAN